MLRGTIVEVDMWALVRNYGVLRSCVGANVQVYGVVKADAYGMGMLPVADALVRAGCTRFAVATPDEAVALRDAGIGDSVLVLGATPVCALREMAERDITVSVGDTEQVCALLEYAASAGRKVQVHVKIDTGMGRFGFLPGEAIVAVPRLCGSADVEGIYTHFASADGENQDAAQAQFRMFGDVLDSLRGLCPGFRIRHACNSAATLRFTHMHLDAVRPGLALYGMPPDNTPMPEGIDRVWRLVTNVAAVRTLPEGWGVSYGSRYVTDGSARMAVLPIGYGDGVSRGLSGKMRVLIRGQEAPQVGTICMDCCMADVSAIEGVTTGDEVVLIGRQGKYEITPEEWAASLGTINYEIGCMLLPRVERVYSNNLL